MVRLGVFLAALCATIVVAAAQTPPAPSAVALPPHTAPNWCSEAEAHLTRNGAPYQCANLSTDEIARVPLCVRGNNYWCMKQGSSPWRGSPDAAGRDGARDPRGHAIFASSDWAARAAATVLRTYHRRGDRSALQIAARYSPWCDTHGSRAVVRGSGRTCTDGEHPPADFQGPLCEAPTALQPTEADCKPGCNCPIEIARRLVEGTGLTIYDDLLLFSAENQPQANLSLVLRNLARQETGYTVSDQRISDGIALMSR